MAISAQQLTIYLYSAHRAVIFAIAQLSCFCGSNRHILFPYRLQGSLPAIVVIQWIYRGKAS